MSSPSQTEQQNAYNDANSATSSPYEEMDMASYQQLPSQTGGQYDYIDLDHPSPYELLNNDRQRPAAYEQLAT